MMKTYVMHGEQLHSIRLLQINGLYPQKNILSTTQHHCNIIPGW